MRIHIYKLLGSIARGLPHFRGKYTIGRSIRKILLPDTFHNSEPTWIKMKSGYFIPVSLVNETDLVAFWCGNYDTVLISKFASIFEDDWIILDVGANIGYYTIPFGLAFQGQVHAFEPLTTNFNLLSAAVQQNACSNVHTHNFGLGDNKGKFSISLTESGNTGNAVLINPSLKSEKGFSPTEDVQIERLDDFYVKHGIKRCDFIKVDIEGAEIFFLSGGIKTITKYRPIIYGEFNTYFIEKNQQSFKQVWNQFRELDYRFFNQDYQEGKIQTTFSEVHEYKDGMQDVLMIPKETDEITVSALII